MSFNILNHIYSALFVFSIIVFFEVLFFLKKNKELKLILLFYITGVLIYSSANIYCTYVNYNRILLGISTPILTVCFMALFSTLCYNKIKPYIIVFSFIIIVSHLSILLYFLFFNPIDLSISLSKNNILGDNLSYIKLTFILFIFGITTKLYIHMNKKYEADNIYFKSIKKWSVIFLVSIFLILIGGIFRIIIGEENLISKYIVTLTLFITTISLLFRPKFLNNSTLSFSLGNYFNKKKESELSKATFNDAFFNQLYYLNPDASLEDLSKKLGTSSENLYRYIYKNHTSGFNDLVNENRVKYFIEVVKSKKHSNYTIDALSQIAGFNSRHHLYKPFKKFHGGVPSDFLRSLEYI